MATLGQALLELKNEINGHVKFGEVVRVLKGRGFPIFMILFSLPFCLPVQIPGASTPFGIAIAFMGLRIALGKKLWWPESWLERDVPHETLKRIIDAALKFNEKIHKWVFPRFTFLTSIPVLYRCHGLFAMGLGLLLALPLPIPFSNLMTAFPLLFLGIGLLEDDGVFITIAYLWGYLTFGFFIGLFVAGKQLF